METTDTQNITWNMELEKLLAEEGEKALGASWIHGKCESYYASRNQWITIPCVILSTLSGSASIGSQTMFEDAKSASLAIGAVSILVGILQTLGSFWTFAAKQEAHRQAEIQWSKLHRFIAIEMTLPRTERIVAKDMLKIVRETIERLSETCPIVPHLIINEFNDKVAKAYPGVSIPDMANGLKKVGINNHDGLTPRSPQQFSLAKVPKQEENGNSLISRSGSYGSQPKQENTKFKDVERAEGASVVGVVSPE